MVSCAKSEGQTRAAPELQVFQMPSKPFIARDAETRNLIVELRPERPVPQGYAFSGESPSVEVDHASLMITISGFYSFEPSNDPTEKLRQADLAKSFEFDPPRLEPYTIVYTPEEARGFMAKRQVNFAPDLYPRKSEYLFISPTASVSLDPETKTMTVSLSLSNCTGGLKEPVDDDLMVAVNTEARKILVFGAFRYKAPTGPVPKYCRVNPENPKRVFQFENIEAGAYEILYERRRVFGKPGTRPRIISGAQQAQVDLSTSPSN